MDQRKTVLLLIAQAVLLLATNASMQAGSVITTVAGGGPNNMPALSANLARPRAPRAELRQVPVSTLVTEYAATNSLLSF